MLKYHLEVEKSVLLDCPSLRRKKMQQLAPRSELCWILLKSPLYDSPAEGPWHLSQVEDYRPPMCTPHPCAEALGLEQSEFQSRDMQMASLIPWGILIPTAYADTPGMPRPPRIMGATEGRSLLPVKQTPISMMNWPGVPWMLSHFNHVWLFVTLWTVIRQASLSMGFSRQEYSGLPCLPPGDLPNPGIESESLHLLHCRQILYILRHPESPGTIIPWL